MGLLELLGFRLPKVVITDVTRMSDDNVCVAGICGGRTVRLSDPQPTRRLLASVGGIAPGDLIEVQWHSAGKRIPPHHEDARWIPKTVKHLGASDRGEMYRVVADAAFPSVNQAFGSPKYLAPKGNPAFPTHRGRRSLATIIATELRVYAFGDGLRADFRDADGEWRMLPVESIAIRNHFAVCHECKANGKARASAAAVRVGLGRPFRPDGHDWGCFLQLNNVILPDATGSHFA